MNHSSFVSLMHPSPVVSRGVHLYATSLTPVIGVTWRVLASEVVKLGTLSFIGKSWVPWVPEIYIYIYINIFTTDIWMESWLFLRQYGGKIWGRELLG